ncbi:alpha/beta hydrolase-fold protein [Streptomyces sp. NPDC093085]|uniref:alpha/beta hydrolase-fold protein n=1 Tax=Streptomyces sp. NPDC093085 TaxID=3155068 RepID=UPI00343A444F
MAAVETVDTVESPRLRRLVDEVRDEARNGRGPAGPGALDRFWRELAAEGAPLVEPVPYAPDERLVTVVWRADRPAPGAPGSPVAGVYVMANRVTDKVHARRGMMRRLAGTDLWYVSLRLPLGLRCSYRIHPFGPDDPLLGAEGPRSGSARGLPDDRTDPLNRHAGGPFGSLIEVGEVPSLAEWSARAPEPSAGRTDTYDVTAADGTAYRLHRHLPAGLPERDAGLLVLLDGERWFGDFGVVGAITAAVAAGRIPPPAVLGVEAGGPAARMRQLGANPAFIDTLADELVPAATAHLPARPAPRRTILCGQSLGGLTALTAALRRPDAFGTVLAHSASTWWRPGMTARPRAVAADADTWLYEEAARAPVGDVTVRMDVGANEGTMVGHLRALHTLMTERGFDASLNVYTGGHDHCCWAAALMDGLTEVTGDLV